MSFRANCRSFAALRMTTLLGTMVLVAACEIGSVEIPRPPAQVAMHGVLSASATTQVVLLERTRNGSVAQVAPPFDLNDPVVSDEGIAESGATVILTAPDGQQLLGREDNTTRLDRKGEGIYRFTLRGDAIQRGGTYRLAITTRRGEVLTAETSMPDGVAAVAPTQRTYDRTRDTVTIEWPASPRARSYFVRIETPFGPRSFFTDETRIRLAGDLRNIEVDGIPRVFIPGFPQAVTVSAVDSNYYDWFRTHNDAISGSGLINRVRGGIGVFGSLVRLRFENFEVVTPQTEPEAGRFVFVGTLAEQQSTPYLTLELYVESRAARADQADALSGRYEKRPSLGNIGCNTCGLLGSARNGKIELAFLRDWFAGDTAERFSGEIHGDTIVGRYQGLGSLARFVRQP